MGFLKCLGWAAAGVGAVIIAPVTGGGSIAALIGAAGTTTAIGAGIGAASGLAVKSVVDSVTDDSEEKLDSYRYEAEKNKAGWQESERKRQNEAEAHKADMERMNVNLAKLLQERKGIIEELKKSKFTKEEIEFMFILAAAAAQADGVTSDDEIQAGCEAISLLCAQPEEALKTGKDIFAQRITIDNAINRVKQISDVITLKRLEFIIDIVIHTDGYISMKELELVDKFKEHVRAVGAAA